MATIVGITIASMMPSELNRICRSASAIGPLGSSTPSEQPLSIATLIKAKPSTTYRMLDLLWPGAGGAAQGAEEGWYFGVSRAEAGYDGKHRSAGAGVLASAIEGARTEMWRGPQKDDRKKHQRLEADAAGRRRPADDRRQRSGGAADHDVLRRAPLQPGRVNDDV